MKDTKIVVVGVLALAALGFSIFGAPEGPQGPKGDKGDPALGAIPGPEVLDKLFLKGGFEWGSRGTHLASTTASGNATIERTEWRNRDSIEYTPAVGAITLTTMASSSMEGILGSAPGSQAKILVYNATTTTGAASVITWAAGTGVDLQEDEGETVTQNGLEVAKLNFYRKADTDVIMWVEMCQVGD